MKFNTATKNFSSWYSSIQSNIQEMGNSFAEDRETDGMPQVCGFKLVPLHKNPTFYNRLNFQSNTYVTWLIDTKWKFTSVLYKTKSASKL